jgi:hypothetical protein
MASKLTYTVDADGKAIRLTLATTSGLRPGLVAVDPSTGDVLYVVDLPTAGGFYNWKIPVVQDMVVLVNGNGVEPLPVLVNVRVRRALAHQLRKSATGCPCSLDKLDELRFYHGLCLLLFHEGDFIGCQQHLTLLQDLEPCGCDC